MVRRISDTREYAAYALPQVRDSAEAGRVDAASSRVQHDYINLGFSLEQVCECLATLEEAHFSHSARYEGTEGWFDVYCRRYGSPSGVLDDLYIKLRLKGARLVLLLCSFHRER